MMNDLQKKKIRWRCRRGMLELDCLLQPFFDKHFEQLNLQEQQVFEGLLQSEDQTLYDWFYGKSAPERVDFKNLITKIRLSIHNISPPH